MHASSRMSPLSHVLLLLALSPVPAWGQAIVPWQAVCAGAEEALDELAAMHGEQPAYEAATAEGFRLMILVAPDGGYSVAIEVPAQKALCLLSVGTGLGPAAVRGAVGRVPEGGNAPAPRPRTSRLPDRRS
jgi:hypothetical protein